MRPLEFFLVKLILKQENPGKPEDDLSQEHQIHLKRLVKPSSEGLHVSIAHCSYLKEEQKQAGDKQTGGLCMYLELVVQMTQK